MRIALAALFALAFLGLSNQAPVNKQVSYSEKTHPVSVVVKAPTPVIVAKPQPEIEVASQPPQQSQVATFASGCSTYDSIFKQYAWNVTVAEAICQAESGGNPYAVSPTQDYGLMQINQIHADMVNGDLTALYSPSENISVAYKLYSADGWVPWSTYLSGAYQRYL